MSKGKEKKPKDKTKWKARSRKNYKDAQKVVDEIQQSKEDEYRNDAAWYIPDEMLRKQIGSFSFSNTIGVKNVLEWNLDGNTYDNDIYVGNVMSINVFPYPGENRNELGLAGGRSAINQSALKLYTQISAVNAKTTQYQPEDLAIAIMAIGEVISMVSQAQRMYGVAFQFNPRNRTLPRDLILAMGIEPDSLLNDLSGFRMKLNKILTAASNIRMLKDIKYFTKCWTMFSEVFFDKNSAMGQYYVLYSGGYLALNEEAPELGRLVWTGYHEQEQQMATPANPVSADQFLNCLSHAVNYILESSLFNYVFTDIVNYVTKQGGDLLGFSYVPELYQVTPIFSELFMTQMHNMDWGLTDLSTYNIYEDVKTNKIYASDIFKAPINDELANCSIWGNKILDFPYTDQPTVDDVIDACAFKIAAKYVTHDETYHYPSYIAAFDHPVHSVYVVFTNAEQSRVLTLPENNIVVSSTGNVGIDPIVLTDAFDVQPIIYSTQKGNYHRSAALGGLNFWTTISYEQLANMAQYYFLGLFDAKVKEGRPFSQ